MGRPLRPLGLVFIYMKHNSDFVWAQVEHQAPVLVITLTILRPQILLFLQFTESHMNDVLVEAHQIIVRLEVA